VKKILVAEDDATTRQFFRGVLKAAGYSVAAAANGRTALDQLKKSSFDLLITDIWMPRMDGFELMARVRERGKGPKVVVLTSDDTPETLLTAVREQAYNYLRKPVDRKELVRVVESALEADGEAPPIEVLSAKPNWVELLVPCDLNSAERIIGILLNLKADLPDEVREQVGHAFRELLHNAIEWGGKLDPNQKVRISYLRAHRMLLYRIADPGGGFRFEGLSHAALVNPPDEPTQHLEVRAEKGMRPGGFGLVMVKAMVDELLYNEAQNEVVFIKYLDT
jgi:CheY-like chemotaxis protein/anti-sigma regulatory factor (Ser/Thr protein kinase)